MRKPLSLALVALMLLSLLAWAPAFAAADELKTFTVLGPEGLTLTYEEAKGTHTFKALEEMFAEKGIKLEVQTVAPDQYLTVLQATIASGKLPDFFDASYLSTPSCINLIRTGKLSAIDDILPYSDGTASFAFSDEGYYSVCREKDVFEDGKLYYFGNVSMLVSVDDPTFGLHNVTANTFLMKIRQDWLDKVNLPLPTTLDEFHDALVAFQRQDANGNGVADERMVIMTDTCNSNWGGFFDNGIAQWFGLANYVFQLNRDTWQLEVPFLQEGFIPYMAFLKKCVDSGVLHLSDVVGKGDANLTTLLAQDVASAYFFSAHADMSASGRDAGAADEWTALPIIEGVPGLTPSLDASRGYKAWNYWGISATADPQAAAAFLDVITSTDYSIWYTFGCTEGVTYERMDSGLLNYIGPTKKDDYLATGYCKGQNIMTAGFLPQPTLLAYYQTYDGERLFYDSYQAFQDSAYFNEYFTKTLSEKQVENLLAYLGMAEKLNLYNQNSDLSMIVPMATVEEAEIIDMYRADLYTYMDEVFANLLSGTYSLENYDQYVEQMKSLGLEELMKVYQAQYDRIAR